MLFLSFDIHIHSPPFRVPVSQGCDDDSESEVDWSEADAESSEVT